MLKKSWMGGGGGRGIWCGGCEPSIKVILKMQKKSWLWGGGPVGGGGGGC